MDAFFSVVRNAINVCEVHGDTGNEPCAICFKKEREHDKEEKLAYEGNATRSKSDARYDLIPAIATRKLAQRYHLGATKHGDNNWKSGGKKFILSTISHLQNHIDDLKINGNVGDDNIGAILWAGAALAYFNEYKRTEFEAAIKELQ